MLKVCRTSRSSRHRRVDPRHRRERDGKEVLVRALHRLSDRRSRRLVPSTARRYRDPAGSELFGFEKGLSPARSRRRRARSRWRTADTVPRRGRRPLAGAAAKLLRFLQEKVIERIGAGRRSRGRARRLRHAPRPRGDDQSRRVPRGLFYASRGHGPDPAAARSAGRRDHPGTGLLQRYAAELRRQYGLLEAAIAIVEQYRWPATSASWRTA